METPPLEDSFDASDVATPCTVIERLRLKDDSIDERQSNEDDSEDFDGRSQSSTQFSQTSEATTTVKQPFPQTSTKVYCHIDDEPTLYLHEVHVPPDLITLGDVKRVLGGTRKQFKCYCKTFDPDSGYEVKAEVRDDAQRLVPSPNGLFELFLLTIEGSTHSDGSSGKTRKYSVPAPAPSNNKHMPMNYHHAAYQFDNSMMSTDSESMISAAVPTYLKNAYQRRFPYLGGHRRHVEESTIGSESDARVFSDDDDRGSTTTDFTSVSRQHEKMANKKKKNRKNFRKPSRASSFSSITESSMSLDVITVTLNMDTVNFLGISIVGQTSTRGDNGIYVANIMKGGAVALDGRIEAGDMILQVNETSFENFTNDQAVDVLREAVSRRGPIKLTVAKSFENGPQSCFTIPRNSREEPVRPIDTQAWIQHTNAAMRQMPSIVEESAPTPIPGEWPHGRPASSSTVTSNGSNGQNTVVGNGTHIMLDIHTDKKKVVEVMAMPSSGLDFKTRTWLKIPIPNSFLGSDLVEWLLEHVEGLREKKDARKYAADLLKLKYIAHAVNKTAFSDQCYYVLGEECAEFARFRNEDAQKYQQWVANGGIVGAGSSSGGQPIYGANKGGGIVPSMVSGYASMPVSPFPMTIKRELDQRSQASGSSRDSVRKRTVILPPKPSSSSGGGSGIMDEVAMSRQSFRAAMHDPLYEL